MSSESRSEQSERSAPSKLDVAGLVGARHRAGIGKRAARWTVGLLLAAAGLAGIFLWWSGDESTEPRFVLQEVERGNLTVTVSATGTLEPTNEIEIGSELSGTIKDVFVDFNDRVEEGQVLARINTDELEATVAQKRAAVQAAEATVTESQATVLETHLQYERYEKLLGRDAATRDEFDVAHAAYTRAKAKEANAKAQVAVAQAALDADELKLKKAVIYAPIDGVVLRRNVDPGQTVAATFQTPVLFTLAEDLTQMEMHVDVDEADVGQVREGHSARFTVDAYPDRSFEALVRQVRYAPETVQGVVTYETILDIDNSKKLLRPGMTATAEITIQTIQNAVLVPNAALRFTSPSAAQEPSDSGGGGLIGRLLPWRPPHRKKDKRRLADGRSLCGRCRAVGWSRFP
jgi:HlyD family secretion protein